MAREINIELPDVFDEIWQPYRYKVFHGGRGSGKSHSVARYLLVRSLQGKFIILCCREFQNSINESCHRLLSTLISDLGLDAYFKITQTNITSAAGSEFIFKGLAQNTEGIKSLEGADYCWVEEAATVSDRSWEILIPTIRKPGSEIIVTFNPDDEKDPTYSRFVKNPPPGTLLRQVNWVHNPYMPDVLRTELEHCKSTDIDRYNYIWLGVPRSQGKAAVFHGKVRSTHFSSSGVDVFRYGMDFGFGSDPTCALRCFIRDRVLHIDYEAYAYGLELAQMHPFICESIPGAKRANQIWCDASRPETIAFLGQAAPHNDFSPLNTIAAPKWSGSVEDGLAFLNSFDKIDIHPRCKNTLFDFQSYSYKIDPKTDEILPVLKQKYDHGPDAARYALAPIITRRNSVLDAL